MSIVLRVEVQSGAVIQNLVLNLEPLIVTVDIKVDVIVYLAQQRKFGYMAPIQSAIVSLRQPRSARSRVSFSSGPYLLARLMAIPNHGLGPLLSLQTGLLAPIEFAAYSVRMRD